MPLVDDQLQGHNAHNTQDSGGFASSSSHLWVGQGLSIQIPFNQLSQGPVIMTERRTRQAALMLVYAQDPGSNWGRLQVTKALKGVVGIGWGSCHFQWLSSTQVLVPSPTFIAQLCPLKRVPFLCSTSCGPVAWLNLHWSWQSWKPTMHGKHSYMKKLCPSQHMEVLADREYSVSSTVWHRVFRGPGLFHGNIQSGGCRCLGLGSVWDKIIGFCLGCVDGGTSCGKFCHPFCIREGGMGSLMDGEYLTLQFTSWLTFFPSWDCETQFRLLWGWSNNFWNFLLLRGGTFFLLSRNVSSRWVDSINYTQITHVLWFRPANPTYGTPPCGNWIGMHVTYTFIPCLITILLHQ